MIAMLISTLVRLGVPPRLAKPVLAIIGLVALVGALWGLKSLYDHRVVEAHEAKRDVQIAKADRKADEHAAEQRRADDARETHETQEVKEAINEAKSEGRDPRAAYYRCVVMQQSARANGKPSPDC